MKKLLLALFAIILISPIFAKAEGCYYSETE